MARIETNHHITCLSVMYLLSCNRGHEDVWILKSDDIDCFCCFNQILKGTNNSVLILLTANEQLCVNGSV